MVLTFSAVLIGLLFLIKPLQKNNFYILNCAIVILSAYYVQEHYFWVTPFAPKTFLLFVVFQFISINLVTVFAYWCDKRAAVNGGWRVPEINLHTLEFLGGWSGALLAQKLFRHKTKKRSFRAVFWIVPLFQVAVVLIILRFLGML